MREKFFIFFIILSMTGTACALEGDVNSDGRVTSTDALLALRMSVGKIPQNTLADIDKSGDVTTVDAARILLLAVGWKEESDGELFGTLKTKVEDYNKNQDKVPDIIKGVFGNEKVDVTLKMNDKKTMKIRVNTKDGKVTEFNKGEIPDPTLKLSSTENAVNKIIDSKDPVDEYLKALDKNEITIDGTGIINNAKVFVVNAALKIYGIFT